MTKVVGCWRWLREGLWWLVEVADGVVLEVATKTDRVAEGGQFRS